MSGDELRTRVAQEISKRIDLVRYRAGYRFTGPPLGAATRSPKFFFSPDQLVGRAALLRKYLPSEVEQIIVDADDICRHRFSLLGYEKLDYGPQIDWHFDAVHGKRAPLKPWYKVRFLDFSEVGDHKVTWELNRHQHLVTLAKAWCLTQDTRYLTELSDHWYGWQRSNPYPIGINWGSALEVAFRSLSWLWIRNLIGDADAGAGRVPASFRDDLVSGLWLTARYIELYLSTYFSPNTHLLGEGLGLFFIGMLCPQLADADRWRDKGWKILLREAKHQVRPEGVYFEQALYYHVYALDFFLHARVLAARNGTAIPAEFDTVVEKMLDVVEALSQAGPTEGFGDDDGGRLFNSRRNRPEHMTDPLALGAAIYGEERITAAATLTEEAIWLFGDHAVELFAKPRPPRDIRSRSFDGIYVLAGADPCPQQMMIDAGPQGTGRCGHGHADALSVRFSVNGRPYLIDPGTGSYISDPDDRALFRATSAHNTLCVDGLDQALPAGPFAWTSIPNVKTERWVSGETFDLFVGTHDGYCRLAEPVRHRRTTLRINSGVWMIRDLAEGQGLHLLETFWHFAPNLQVREEAGALIALPASGQSAPGDSFRLALLKAQDSPWRMEMGSGLYSPAYGIKEPAPMARISTSIALPAECAVMLVCHKADANPGRMADITENARLRAYRYEAADATHLFFYAYAATAESWTHGLWTSDAQFLYCRLEHGRLSHLILVAGSVARWHGTAVVSHSRPVERFECLYERGKLKTFSSDSTALEQVLETKFERLDPVL